MPPFRIYALDGFGKTKPPISQLSLNLCTNLNLRRAINFEDDDHKTQLNRRCSIGSLLWM
uniref:Uncharacterized protein n=1 Tax=Oryza meridionalis TaxID=40149 RepID=A0A0E0D3H2_9ORYZ